MTNDTAATKLRAWLIPRSGVQTGTRYVIGEGTTRVGRSPGNDVTIQGPDAASVSLEHLEIVRTPAGFQIRDLDSTNGTFLNGERIAQAELLPMATVRLGTQGPEFSFVLEEPVAVPLDRTIEIPLDSLPASVSSQPLPAAATYDGMLSDAVARARHARWQGQSNQTLIIMRDTLNRVRRRTGRRLRIAIGVLAAGLVLVSGYAAWKIVTLSHDRQALGHRIAEIEAQLQKTAGSYAEADRLVTQLDQYEGQLEQLERNPFYRISGRGSQDFLAQDIRSLMAEFGAEVYSIPPEFAERVNHYIDQYQGADRPLMEKALGLATRQLQTMRQLLEAEKLPPDLAYIPLVESALVGDQTSQAGAAGPWQFTPATAKAYGLRVDKTVDERLDLKKSTRAGCGYLRDLILDFGSGSSVMLALAAYNLGPTKVKHAIMNTVQDPIKQRNFWYLYRVKALPAETREYVPKVVAAIIIGRSPQRFGF
jgi:pSer/pThr/pTyr-binding forkhead associated (FHA) protein